MAIARMLAGLILLLAALPRAVWAETVNEFEIAGWFGHAYLAPDDTQAFTHCVIGKGGMQGVILMFFLRPDGEFSIGLHSPFGKLDEDYVYQAELLLNRRSQGVIDLIPRSNDTATAGLGSFVDIAPRLAATEVLTLRADLKFVFSLHGIRQALLKLERCVTLAGQTPPEEDETSSFAVPDGEDWPMTLLEQSGQTGMRMLSPEEGLNYAWAGDGLKGFAAIFMPDDAKAVRPFATRVAAFITDCPVKPSAGSVTSRRDGNWKVSAHMAICSRPDGTGIMQIVTIEDQTDEYSYHLANIVHDAGPAQQAVLVRFADLVMTQFAGAPGAD